MAVSGGASGRQGAVVRASRPNAVPQGSGKRRRRGAFRRLGIAGLAALAGGLLAAPAAAGDIELVCPCSVEKDADSATFTFGVHNFRSTVSGALRAQVLARPAGSGKKWRKIASVTLNDGVAADASIPRTSHVLALQAPGDGRRDLLLRLRERRGSGWSEVDFIRMAGSVDFPQASFKIDDLDYLADADGDGVGDVNERLMDTDPDDAASTPGVSIIDVLALHSRSFAESYEHPHTRILHMMTVTNRLYHDSATGIRLRTVGIVEAELTDSKAFGKAPPWEVVTALRGKYGADLVVMFRASTTDRGYCGRAYLGGFDARGHMNSRFYYASVFGDCADTTLAHEIGHMLGLGHSFQGPSGVAGTFRWSRGHNTDVESSSGTIMTYAKRMFDVFSNPSVDCDGSPCGVAIGDYKGANAVKSIQTTRFQVAHYLEEKPDSDGDGFVDPGDAFPNDPAETRDTDGDGVGDNTDIFPNDPAETRDTDGDGVGDNADIFPNDPAETRDTDGDGVGDNADADDDNDGVADIDDRWPLALQSIASYQFVGDATADDFAGKSLSPAGDVNGDGWGDILVGAPSYNFGGEAGVVYLVSGADLGSADAADGQTDRVIDLRHVAAQANSWKLVGEAAGDEMGRAVAGGGDLNGDGLVDLIIGAPYLERPDGKREGAVYLIAGTDLAAADVADGALDGVVSLRHVAAQSGSWKLVGMRNDNAGTSAAALGDIDYDGLAEVLVGAHYHWPGGEEGQRFTGAAYLVASGDLAAADAADGGQDGVVDLDNTVSQPNSWKLVGKAGSKAGTAVGAAGDVDGDGLADLMVGAPYRNTKLTYPYWLEFTGAAYLVGGGDLAAADVADGKADGVIQLDRVAVRQGSWKFQGWRARGYAGLGVSSAGDVDGDGFPELLIRAEHSLYIVSSAALPNTRTWDNGVIPLTKALARMQTVREVEVLPRAAAAAVGDVDGDGQAELLISDGTGLSYLLSEMALKGADAAGGRNGVIEFSRLAGRKDALGITLGQEQSASPAGDVDGDGLADVLFGAPSRSTAYLLLAADLEAPYKATGDRTGGRSGRGDMDERAPGQVGAPSLTPDDGQVDVSWAAPPDAGSTAIVGYHLQYRSGGGAWATSWERSTVTVRTITGLTNGRTYEFQVRAVNESLAVNQGRGPWSGSASATPAVPTVAPGAPSLTLVVRSATSLRTVLHAPASDGGQAIDRYELQRKPASSNTWTGVVSDWQGPGYNHKGLTTGASYDFRARAHNAVGWGGWSDVLSGAPAAAPDAPGALVLTPGDGELGVLWMAPAANGAVIVDYDVDYRSGSGDWSAHEHVGAGTSTTISRLANGRSHEVRVLATNARGSSDWSRSANATPMAVARAPGKAGTPTLTVGDRQMTLSWAAPVDAGSTAIVGYHLQYRSGGGAWATSWERSTATVRTITGLTNGRTYEFQVRAVNKSLAVNQGRGPWSGSASATPAAPTVAPGAPSLTLVVRSATSLRTVLHAPVSDGGQAIDRYELQRKPASSNAWAGVVSDWQGPGYNHNGLTAGASYDFRARAHNAVGWGGWSDVLSGAPAVPPGAPSLTLVVRSATSLRTVLHAPVSDGGQAIDRYELQRKPASSNAWAGVVSDWQGPGYNHNGLTAGASYDFRARAHNAVGWGGWSDVLSGAPAAAPDAPGAPVLTPGDGELGVLWTAPAANGAVIVDYDVDYRSGSGDWSAHEHVGAGTSTTISGLANGRSHEVRVLATNAQGSSGWSPSANATPVAAVDGPLTGAGDHDTDDDGLIEISTAAQLDAIRHDLDGDGAVDAGGDVAAYESAFAAAVSGMGCRSSGCAGYELGADLDLWGWDDAGGWLPVGGAEASYRAVFEGNGRVIANLWVDRGDRDWTGLFGSLGRGAEVRNVGLEDADVHGQGRVGALAGENEGGDIRGCYATGRVRGAWAVGGLVGRNTRGGSIRVGYSTARVEATSTLAGGLVGVQAASLSACYAMGAVSGANQMGGLIGVQGARGSTLACYATGTVSGPRGAGGLMGAGSGEVTDSYWDTEASGRSESAGGTGRTTAELQAPADYEGVYAAWNLDLDEDGVADDPWDFGTDDQYPALKADFDRDGQAGSAEFGGQGR